MNSMVNTGVFGKYAMFDIRLVEKRRQFNGRIRGPRIVQETEIHRWAKNCFR
jgi:hypothetical protein